MTEGQNKIFFADAGLYAKFPLIVTSSEERIGSKDNNSSSSIGGNGFVVHDYTSSNHTNTEGELK